MSKLKLIAASVSMAASVFIAAPISFAQDILVVDTATVLQDSKAGQDIETKVRQIGDAMQSELQPEQNALKTEKASLDAKIEGKTQDDIRADQALVAQGQAYTRKLQAYAQKTDKRSKELVATERTALSAFGEKMSEAAEAIRVQKGAKIVMTSADVYLFDDSVDITQEVIAKMDQDSPTIAVTRVTLPDQPAQQQR